jgi:signal transduction histidine kinase
MSIRTRLILIALLATLLVSLVIGWRFVQDRDRAVSTAMQQLPALASSMANAVGERVQGTEQLFFGLARSQGLDTRDRLACSAFLSQVRDKYPQYTGILTIRPDGQLFCDSLRTGRNLDLTDRDYFKRAQKLTDAIAMQPAFGRLTGTAVLQVAYPVRGDTGELRYVLLASIHLARIVMAQLHDAIVPGTSVLVVDRYGLVLLSSGELMAEVQPGTSIAKSGLFRFAQGHAGAAAGEYVAAAGDTQVWAVAVNSITAVAGIYVMAGQPKSDLVATANRRLAEDMLILAGTVMFGFLALWYFTEVALRRPIATIAAMIKRLRHGDLDARIPAPHPRGELGVLMQELNDSAQAQQQQRIAIQELNARLRESQRLEAVGQLTGGVAHDFNNLLTVILGNAEVLRERLGADPKLALLADMVVEAAERGAQLTHRLLAFARKQALEPQVVEVNQRVADMDAMLRRTLGEHIEIEFTQGAGLWPALVDPAQLDNALLNLCLNSRDAMPHGGRLTLETANAYLGHDYVQAHADVKVGQYVMLAVSDNGSGIAPQHLARVFEPFFTTKEKGKGTGLGLAMIYGFAKQSGGHVSIYSEPGQGTTVKLYLPRAGYAQAQLNLIGGGMTPAGGNETVLLVEDDMLVRRFAHEQLLALGYTVIAADNGAQALAVLQAQERRQSAAWTSRSSPTRSSTPSPSPPCCCWASAKAALARASARWPCR